MSNVRLFSRVLAGFAVLALMVGCGGSAPPALSVAVTPTTATLVAGATQTFTATVTNDGATPGVTWSASVGTITSGGVYTAPTPVATATATITATSKSDTTKTATATVTLTPIAVSITTTPVAMIAGATQQFAATVTGDATLNQGVTWTATVGTITAAGLYTAPTPVATATATIIATSRTDTNKTGTSTVTLTPISVAITTTPVAMVAGATQTFAATVSNDITPSGGVTWSASVGTITAAGLYTAPTPVATATATITATSRTDTTKTATSTVTLTPIAVTIPTTPTAIAGAATEAITASVANDITPSAGVTWSITSGGGTLSAVTTTSVTYTAPLPVTTATAVITATSRTDTTKTATITIPLTPISLAAISPATASMGNSNTQAFTDSVNNDSSNSGVSWSIGSGVGTLTASSITGVTYNAPTTVISSVTTVTLTATSIKDTTKTTTATITLNPIAIAAVSPATISLNGGGTQTFTGAALTYDGSSSGVTWSISPATGAGTIVSTTGVYTAPAVVSATTTVTVTATSVKDNTKTATATITLNPISVSFGSTTSATLDAGQSYSGVQATIGNDSSNSGITFTIATGGGTFVSSGTSTLTVTGAGPNFAVGYNTPATVASQTTTTITAASVKDPTKTATFTVTLNPAMSWSTPSSNTATLTGALTNTAYTYTFVVAGGTGSKTYTVTSGTLPTGLSLNTSTGAITGSPTGGAGSSTFVVRTTDQSSNPSILNGTFTIVVTVAPLAWSSPTSGPSALTVGTAITPITLTATGGSGALTYSLNSGTLPAGLSIVGNQVTGTPTQPTLVAGTAVTFKATDSTTPTANTINSPSITIVVNPVTLAITSTALPTGMVGTAYSYQLASTGGTGTINWSLSAGSLTGTGLTLTNAGVLAGTPLIVESALSLTFQAQDSATNQQQTKTAVLPLTIYNPLTITTTQSSLPYAYSGLAYTSTTLAATGGLSPYTWSVTSGLTGTNSLATLNLAVSSAGVITGTPTATGTANFTVQVADSVTPTHNTTTATYTITAYVPLSLPTSNPSTLPAAITSSSYTGSIVATGGVGSTYTWTVNGSNATTGSVSLGNGTMQAVGSGATLNITGTPSSTGTISFTASIKDSANTTVGPTTYTIAVSANYSIGGSISLNNNCNSTSPPTITLTLTQGSTTIQTQSTNSSGNFSFTNIPAGTYTVTPSITGPSSVFYPATKSVIVTTSNITNANFGVTLGYNVSGTVSYSGSHTVSQANPIYLSISGGCSGGNGNPGTSISATGSYTIHGVSPGTYTLSAFQDNLGYGSQNSSNPTGSTSSVTVAAANLTGANVTLTDPAATTLSAAPTLQGVNGFNNGAFAQYKPIKDSNGVEMATSYTLQWSTTSTFTAIAGSKTLPATGSGGPNIWFLNSSSPNCTNCSTLTNGSVYYFRAYGTSAGTATSPYGVYSSSGNPVAVTIGAPTGGVAVSGTVTYPGTATGPLYVGFYNYNTGNYYGQYIASPASAQAYTASVPIASTYYFVGIIDNNNSSVLDVGDISDVNGTPPIASITGATSSQNLTLTSSNSSIASYTGHYIQIQTSSSDSYSVNANVKSGIKLPVAVELISATNPNVIVPQDIALCTNCGNHEFQWQDSTFSTVPVAGDSYGLKVTYSDGTSDASLPSTVTAVLTSAAAVTNLAPQTGTSTSTQPTFTWTYPANASNYTYAFALYPPSGGTDIWDIPGNGSNSNGFTSSVVNIPWITSGNDVLGAANLPSVTNLSTSTNYGWNIEVLDSNFNYVRNSVNYQP